ncbi:MAG: hypothetical protein M3Q26_10780 [Acidobacteriota bacterium]|nr:hypothetical protein [Acidobacteriota bacterium]
MILSLILIALIALGGMSLTYIFADDEPLLWRLSAGTVIGSAIFGTIVFVTASFFGLNATTVLASFIITLTPLLLLKRKNLRRGFLLDRRRANDQLRGKSPIKLFNSLYYVFFVLLFLVFFERTMFETSLGIFTGGSQNLGDLPFHLGAIFSFTEANNFPPKNPSFAGARFSYPFIADIVTASFMKLGIGVKDAMLVQNIAWAFSLLVILERFVFKLTNDRLAAKIAPALLYFSGGLGFLWFFNDYWQQGKNFLEFIWALPKDYTISESFRWGNSLVALFLTQRSLLLGMPLSLIVLGYLWKIFTAETQRRGDVVERKSLILPQSSLIPFAVGLFAGLLPLIHLHSLAILFIVTAFLFLLKPDRWLEWIAFGIGVSLIAVPQLIWSMSGSASEAGKFFEWHFGWDSRDSNFLWFWFKNTGIVIPFTLLGFYLVFLSKRSNNATGLNDAEKSGKAGKKKKLKDERLVSNPPNEARDANYFYLPFVFLFLAANSAKLAPWEWDNIKVLIYWFVGSIPFIAFALAWLWRKSTPLKIGAAFCFIFLILSGALDVWRTVSGQIKNRIFDADAVVIADKIKLRTAPNALFLNAPTYNSAVVLTGRQSLMRYPGHLSSHGIEYAARENDVKIIYSGGPAAAALLQKYGIEYVLISPEERNTLRANENFFIQYPVIAEEGQYKVYKVQN